MKISFSRWIKLFPSAFETYWNNKWKQSNLMYATKGDRNVYPVTEVFGHGSLELQSLSRQVCNGLQNDDEKALACFEWVRHNIQYKTDRQTQGVVEYWQDANETFASGQGDCEDGAILMMKLMELSGVPAWRRKLCAGWVRDPRDVTKQVGHAYCIYLNDYFEWMVLDWCYWPNTSEISFKDNISLRKQTDLYKELWFTCNEERSWLQKDTIIHNI